jgi:hypothetical protein
MHIDYKTIIINVIFSSVFMMIFAYVFFFHFIVHVENQKIAEIIDLKLIPPQFIAFGKNRNKELVSLANKMVIYYSSIGFVVGLFLVYIFKKNIYEVFKYNIYLIILTAAVEFMFILTFLPTIGILDSNDIINNNYIGLLEAYYANYLNFKC